MDQLARLRNELEEQKLGLTALRGRLDAERLREQPDRAEQRRLRDLIGEHETTIAEINLWIELFIERVLPFERSFQYSLNRNQNSRF